MENNENIMENEVMNEVQENTESELIAIEPAETTEIDVLVPAVETPSEEDEPSTAAVVLIGAATAALAGLATVGIAKGVKALKHKDESPAKGEQPADKPVKGKREKIKVKRGEKLSLVDRITGYTHIPVAANTEESEYDSEEIEA